MIPDEDLFWYRAAYEKNYDGDTVTVLIDLGFCTFIRTDIRLYGINTPEMRGPTREKALQARDFLHRLLEPASAARLLRLKSYKDQNDKYGGRKLGEFWVPTVCLFSQDKEMATSFDVAGEWTNINQLMIRAGLATPYFGTGEK